MEIEPIIRERILNDMAKLLTGGSEEIDGRFVVVEKGEHGEDIIYISEPQGEAMLIVKLEARMEFIK